MRAKRMSSRTIERDSCCKRIAKTSTTIGELLADIGALRSVDGKSTKTGLRMD